MPLFNFQRQEMKPTQIPLNPNENDYIDGIISLWYYHYFIIIMLNLASVISDTVLSSYFTHIKIRFFDKICNLHVDIIILHVDLIIFHVDITFLYDDIIYLVHRRQKYASIKSRHCYIFFKIKVSVGCKTKIKGYCEFWCYFAKQIYRNYFFSFEIVQRHHL